MKKNKGITQIALIMSILVILIPVGVTVNVIINSKMLGSAKNESQKWKEEATKSNIVIDGAEYANMEDYMQNMLENY